MLRLQNPQNENLSIARERSSSTADLEDISVRYTPEKNLRILRSTFVNIVVLCWLAVNIRSLANSIVRAQAFKRR